MNELAVYKRELSAALNCPNSLRCELIERMECMAVDFLVGKPDATWDEVRAFLGDPRELADTMLEGIDWKTLTRYRKRKQYWKRFAVGVVLILCISLSALLVYILHMRAEAPPVTATETLIIYEPIEEQDTTG